MSNSSIQFDQACDFKKELAVAPGQLDSSVPRLLTLLQRP